MSFRLVPDLMALTLDDLERRNSPNRNVISPKFGRYRSGLQYINVMKIRQYTFCSGNVGQRI